MDGMEASRRIIGDAAGHQGDAAAAGSQCLRETALVGVIYPQAGLGINAVVDGSADTVVIGRSREDLDPVVDRPDSFDVLENITCAAFEIRTRGKAFENHGFAMETERDPIENPVVGEAAKPLLRLFGDAQRVVLRPGRGGVLGNEGKVKDESSRNRRQCTASQSQIERS